VSAEEYDDYKSAFLNWLKEDTGLLVALPGTIVTARLPDKKGDPPGHMLSARRVGGQVGQDNYPDHRPRLDVFCYASSPLEAQRLASQVIKRCVPKPPEICGFRKGGVVCTNIRIEMGMIDDTDQRTDWPVCLFSVRLDINPGVTA
jgi:hypothetical protein